MTSMLRNLIFYIIIFSSQTVHASQQDYPFKLFKQAVSGKQIVMAQNNGPAPILLNLAFTVDNAIVEPSTIIVRLIKPGETKAVATISIKTPGQRYRVGSSFKYSIGDPDAQPDPDVVYKLPFKSGQSINIGQVLGGKITTHSGSDSKYAIDFDVPVNTPVLAARKGIVVDIEQGYTQGGNNPALKANHVLILHEDGTLGLYSHLAADSHLVSFGQKVAVGELVGYSGNTGYSTGPHLHFSVLTNTRTSDGTVKYQSQAAKFVDLKPPHEIIFIQGEKLLVNHEGASLKSGFYLLGKEQVFITKLCIDCSHMFYNSRHIANILP